METSCTCSTLISVIYAEKLNWTLPGQAISSPNPELVIA